MLVSLVWPDCRFAHVRWEGEPRDAFWVQCDEADAAHLSPAITDGGLDLAPSVAPARFGPPFCFLVARDQSSVVQMPWHYPYGGLWNASCPFRRLPEALTIASLKDLPAIAIPSELRAAGTRARPGQSGQKG